MDPYPLLVLGGLVWLAGYAAASRIWPYVACPACDGSGKKRSPSGRAWRDCKRCGGSGKQLRIGRRMLNRWSEASRRAMD